MVVGIRAPNGIEGPIWPSFQLLAYLHSVSRIIVDNIVSRSPLSLGDIHDGRNDNVSRVRGHGIKANLNGEFASVFSHAE